MRAQARDWFRADLAMFSQILDAGHAKNREVVVRELEHWTDCVDLALVRDPDSLKALPEAEQKEWKGLREDVEALLGRAQQRKP